MTPSTVSVILPFRNAERFIEETLDSVLRQTHRDWELLLIDDGSTDASARIASAFCEKNSMPFRIVEHAGRANRGIGASRNLGLREARGEFIAPLDADDVWVPDKLERQLKIFELFPQVAMVYGTYLIWHSWDKEARKKDVQTKFYFDGITDCLVSPPHLVNAFIRLDVTIPVPSSVLVRKTALEEVGGFGEGFGAWDDNIMSIKLFARYPVFFMGSCTFKYRQHPRQITGSGDLFGSLRRQYDWMKAYVSRELSGHPSIVKRFHRHCWLFERRVYERLFAFSKTPPGRLVPRSVFRLARSLVYKWETGEWLHWRS